MTPVEVRAYNAGVRAALESARSGAEALRSVRGWRPTREGAIDALDEFAAAGEALLIGDPDRSAGEPVQPPPSPKPPVPAGQYALPAGTGDDGNFGLSDEEIIRPSRATLIGWLSGRTPMLASHWSRAAAKLLETDGLSAVLDAVNG